MIAMTRRQRCIRILHNFGGLESRNGYHTVKHEFDRLLHFYGLSLLNDEAVELLVSRVIVSHRFSQKLARENRARRERKRDVA